MNYYFITGTGRGIGKALAEALLRFDRNTVFGVSRTKTIEAPNYRHFTADLSDIAELQGFLSVIFTGLEAPEKIVLINNAGTLGEVGYVGEITESDIARTFNLNLTAAAMLTNRFLKKYGQIDCPKVVLNISSGAGRRPIDGWSSYCASKAAIDMYSLVTEQECKIRGLNVRIFSVAPGVVETQMQEKIRSASPEDFSSVYRFWDLQTQKLLDSPENAAAKLLHLLKNPDEFETICDVRAVNP